MRVLAILLAALAVPALAAEGSDPDWPCVQRLQPHLSLAQIWSGPLPDEATATLSKTPEIAALAAALEQRRLPLDEATARIGTFAAAADNASLTALMQAILDRIDPDRAALIEGIGRYGRKQVALAAQIEASRAEMAALEAAEPPDFDAIDDAEAALDWQIRIFTDRQQSLTYVCETPVIMEQRAFALARAISGHLR